MSAPFFSVVLPVYNGGKVFERCLAALGRSEFRDYELLVVDDGSRDGSGAAAKRHGARLLETGGPWGPARARNLGAREAAGDYLFFVDADCEVGPETLGRAAEALDRDPELTGLFGSYDDAPSDPALLSQYKNLQHHWVHQTGREEASSFWAGCGAIRRTVFLELGGFDADRYARPSIEDIELGYRLTAAGHRIRLDKSVQVKHHKSWRLGNLLKTDILDRGIPWTILMLGRQRIDNDLNVGTAGRASGLAAWVLVLSLIGGLFDARSFLVAAACILVLLVANRDFYGFLLEKRGFWFTIRAVPVHWLYYLYSVLAFAVGFVRHLGRRASG